MFDLAEEVRYPRAAARFDTPARHHPHWPGGSGTSNLSTGTDCW